MIIKKALGETVFLKNINFLLIPNLIKLLSNIIILIPVITFYLTVEELGVIALITTSVAFLFSIFNFRTDWILTKNFKILKKKELLFNVFLFDILIKLFLIFITLILIFFINKFNFTSLIIEYKYCIILSFITNIFLSINLTNSTFFHLTKNFKIIFIIEMVKIFSHLFFVYLFFKYFSLGIISVFFGLTVSSFLGFIIELIGIKKFINIKININLLKKCFHFTKTVIAFNVSGTALDFFERFLILKSLNLYAVGIFSHAKMYMYFSYTLIKNTLKTILSDFLKSIKKSDKKKLEKIQEIFLNMNYLFLLFSLLISLTINDFINILTHGKLVESAKYVPFLFLITQIAINQFIAQNYLILQNKIKSISVTTTLLNIFFILSLPITLYCFQLWGAVLSYGLLRFMIVILLQKKIDDFYFSKLNRNFYLTFFISLTLLTILNLSNLNNFLVYISAIFILFFIGVVLKEFIKSLKVVK